MKMMAKFPGDRYQTPVEVAEAVMPWVSPSMGGMGSGLVPAAGLSGVRPGEASGPPSVAQTTPSAPSGHTLDELAARAAEEDAGAPTRAPSLPSRAQASPLSRIPVWAWGAGAAVVVEARHLCMMMRGFERHNADVVTSQLTGEFKTNASRAAEVFQMIGRPRG